MSLVTPMQTANRLSEGLPGKQHDRIMQCSEAVDLLIDHILYQPAQAVRYLHSPQQGHCLGHDAGWPPTAGIGSDRCNPGLGRRHHTDARAQDCLGDGRGAWPSDTAAGSRHP